MKKLCFVLMPFSNKFKNQWELSFVPAIEGLGLTPYRGDEESLGTNMIMRDVTKCISEARIIVADLTDRNPNVMYELGLAHAAKKPVVILTQNDDDIPFDVHHIRYLKYDPYDLKGLQQELSNRIKNTLLQKEKDLPDLFPEIKLLGKSELDELIYLRKRTVAIKIEPNLPTADIFFNDALVGTGNQTIALNPAADRNTISVAAIEHFEHHQDITLDEITNGKITITLEQSTQNSDMFSKRVPRWLRFRRRDPNNPVLMRAISHYLSRIGEHEEALTEANELLEVSPYWYMAHNQASYVNLDMGNYDKSRRHLEQVIALRPDHSVGYLGFSCLYALTGDYANCIDRLRCVLENDVLLETYKYYGAWKIQNDPDYNQLKKDTTYKNLFENIVNEIEARIACLSRPTGI